jgi:ABC-type branched-subunit amino acid transport system permease subunit
MMKVAALVIILFNCALTTILLRMNTMPSQRDWFAMATLSTGGIIFALLARQESK